jgi:four helix bundle protein
MNDGAKPRDLGDRTFEFAQSVRAFVKQLPRTVSNTEDVKQLVRASGSVAANWIEADEALSKKDFLMRVKICPKRSERESALFAISRCRLGQKQRCCARDFNNRGTGADPNFFVDYLEKWIIARCSFWD